MKTSAMCSITNFRLFLQRPGILTAVAIHFVRLYRVATGPSPTVTIPRLCLAMVTLPSPNGQHCPNETSSVAAADSSKLVYFICEMLTSILRIPTQVRRNERSHSIGMAGQLGSETAAVVVPAIIHGLNRRGSSYALSCSAQRWHSALTYSEPLSERIVLGLPRHSMVCSSARISM